MKSRQRTLPMVPDESRDYTKTNSKKNSLRPFSISSKTNLLQGSMNGESQGTQQKKIYQTNQLRASEDSMATLQSLHAPESSRQIFNNSVLEGTQSQSTKKAGMTQSNIQRQRRHSMVQMSKLPTLPKSNIDQTYVDFNKFKKQEVFDWRKEHKLKQTVKNFQQDKQRQLGEINSMIRLTEPYENDVQDNLAIKLQMKNTSFQKIREVQKNLSKKSIKQNFATDSISNRKLSITEGMVQEPHFGTEYQTFDDNSIYLESNDYEPIVVYKNKDIYQLKDALNLYKNQQKRESLSTIERSMQQLNPYQNRAVSITHKMAQLNRKKFPKVITKGLSEQQSQRKLGGLLDPEIMKTQKEVDEQYHQDRCRSIHDSYLAYNNLSEYKTMIKDRKKSYTEAQRSFATGEQILEAGSSESSDSETDEKYQNIMKQIDPLAIEWFFTEQKESLHEQKELLKSCNVNDDRHLLKYVVNSPQKRKILMQKLKDRVRRRKHRAKNISELTGQAPAGDQYQADQLPGGERVDWKTDVVPALSYIDSLEALGDELIRSEKEENFQKYLQSFKQEKRVSNQKKAPQRRNSSQVIESPKQITKYQEEELRKHFLQEMEPVLLEKLRAKHNKFAKMIDYSQKKGLKPIERIKGEESEDRWQGLYQHGWNVHDPVDIKKVRERLKTHKVMNRKPEDAPTLRDDNLQTFVRIKTALQDVMAQKHKEERLERNLLPLINARDSLFWHGLYLDGEAEIQKEKEQMSARSLTEDIIRIYLKSLAEKEERIGLSLIRDLDHHNLCDYIDILAEREKVDSLGVSDRMEFYKKYKKNQLGHDDPMAVYLKSMGDSRVLPLVATMPPDGTMNINQVKIDENHCKGIAGALQTQSETFMVKKLTLHKLPTTSTNICILIRGALHQPMLQYLTLSKLRLDASCVEAIKKHLHFQTRGEPSHLKELALIDCQIALPDTCALLSALPRVNLSKLAPQEEEYAEEVFTMQYGRKLESLRLVGFTLDQKCLSNLCLFISQSQLKIVDLAWTRIVGVDFSNEGNLFVQVLRAIMQADTVRDLNLGWTQAFKNNDELWNTLLELLQQSKVLQHLNLESSGLSLEQIEQLIKILVDRDYQSSHSLLSIHLSYNMELPDELRSCYPLEKAKAQIKSMAQNNYFGVIQKRSQLQKVNLHKEHTPSLPFQDKQLLNICRRKGLKNDFGQFQWEVRDKCWICDNEAPVIIFHKRHTHFGVNKSKPYFQELSEESPVQILGSFNCEPEPMLKLTEFLQEESVPHNVILLEKMKRSLLVEQHATSIKFQDLSVDHRKVYLQVEQEIINQRVSSVQKTLKELFLRRAVDIKLINGKLLKQAIESQDLSQIYMHITWVKSGVKQVYQVRDDPINTKVRQSYEADFCWQYREQPDPKRANVLGNDNPRVPTRDLSGQAVVSYTNQFIVDSPANISAAISEENLDLREVKKSELKRAVQDMTPKSAQGISDFKDYYESSRFLSQIYSIDKYKQSEGPFKIFDIVGKTPELQKFMLGDDLTGFKDIPEYIKEVYREIIDIYIWARNELAKEKSMNDFVQLGVQDVKKVINKIGELSKIKFGEELLDSMLQQCNFIRQEGAVFYRHNVVNILFAVGFRLAQIQPEINGKSGRLLAQLKRVIFPKMTHQNLFDDHPSFWRHTNLLPIDDLLNREKARLAPLMQFVNGSKRLKQKEEVVRLLVLGLDYNQIAEAVDEEMIQKCPLKYDLPRYCLTERQIKEAMVVSKQILQQEDDEEQIQDYTQFKNTEMMEMIVRLALLKYLRSPAEGLPLHEKVILMIESVLANYEDIQKKLKIFWPI